MQWGYYPVKNILSSPSRFKPRAAFI